MKVVLDKSEFSKVYLISDTHFNHANILKYCSRPFKNAAEMDEALIENWNSVVPKDGLIFHLGDFSFSPKEDKNFAERMRAKLNGKMFLVWGNHDHRGDWHDARWVQWNTADLVDLRVGDKSAVLCHYPMVTWNKAHHGAYHFFGHVHANIPLEALRPRAWDVGVDQNNYRPLSLEEAMYLADSHPGNKNISYKKGVELTGI